MEIEMSIFWIDRDGTKRIDKNGKLQEVESNFCNFFNIVLGNIVREYETAGWGEYYWVPFTEIAKRFEVNRSNDYGEISDNVRKEFQRVFLNG